MVDIDMNKEPVSNLLTGTNLWEIRSCAVETSQKSKEKMLVLTLKSGEYELKDRIMLGGGGWFIGKAHLIALGVDPTFSGNLDPLDFVGKRVWIATIEGKFEGVDKKTGAPRTFAKLEVDIDALEHKGYQHASKTPPGAVAATAGNGPDDSPF